jgi:hypothetical protein
LVTGTDGRQKETVVVAVGVPGSGWRSTFSSTKIVTVYVPDGNPLLLPKPVISSPL